MLEVPRLNNYFDTSLVPNSTSGLFNGNKIGFPTLERLIYLDIAPTIPKRYVRVVWFMLEIILALPCLANAIGECLGTRVVRS